MLSKSEKLAQRLQELQDFIAVRVEQDLTFGSISQELEEISNSLRTGNLKIQIVSNNLLSAQAPQNFLGTCKLLPEHYQLHVADFPNDARESILISSELNQLVDCDILRIVLNLNYISSNETG